MPCYSSHEKEEGRRIIYGSVSVTGRRVVLIIPNGGDDDSEIRAMPGWQRFPRRGWSPRNNLALFRGDPGSLARLATKA